MSKIFYFYHEFGNHLPSIFFLSAAYDYILGFRWEYFYETVIKSTESLKICWCQGLVAIELSKDRLSCIVCRIEFLHSVDVLCVVLDDVFFCGHISL